jgi:hypothetical protein
MAWSIIVSYEETPNYSWDAEESEGSSEEIMAILAVIGRHWAQVIVVSKSLGLTISDRRAISIKRRVNGWASTFCG